MYKLINAKGFVEGAGFNNGAINQAIVDYINGRSFEAYRPYADAPIKAIRFDKSEDFKTPREAGIYGVGISAEWFRTCELQYIALTPSEPELEKFSVMTAGADGDGFYIRLNDVDLESAQTFASDYVEQYPYEYCYIIQKHSKVSLKHEPVVVTEKC
ncbi:hypothetical protein [Erwinia phage Virsaitis27]|nr:hypothetical protein [Erwinia phage Virsaitis27]